MSIEIKHLYEFGPFRLDPKKRVLLRGEDPVALTPKAIETLVVLVENRDRVLSKDELIKTLWPDSFVEESNLSQSIFLLRKALGDSAQERRYILTVPGRGYQFTETVRDLGGQQQEQEEVLVMESHSRLRVIVGETVAEPNRVLVRTGVAALIVAALIASGALFYRVHRGKPGESKGTVGQAPGIKMRRSVAVLGFRNLSGRPDKAWLSTALAEMLNTELAAGEQLRTIPGEQIARASLDLPWGETDMLAKDSLARLRSNLGTDYVTLGSYTIVGEGNKSLIRLDFRLQDATAGETLAEDAVTGNEADLFDLISEVGSRMRDHLAVSKVTSEQASQIRSSLPSNPKAERYYAEGLAKFRVFETLAASDLLSKAVAADAKFAGAHAALGAAWFALGYETKAKDETRKAVDLAANLGTEERLSIEAQYRELKREWPQAIQIYRMLADLYPDNLEYGLRLAAAQKSSRAPKDALVTLQTCRRLPSPIGDDPRIDLVEASALTDLGEFKRSQEAAAKAAEKGKLLHVRLVIAQARRQESWPLERMGELDRASANLAEAKVLFASAGDLISSARALIGSGNISYDKADYEGARRQFEEALLIYRQVGSIPKSANALEDIGNAYFEEGKLAQAKGYYEQALRINREFGDKQGIASVLGNIANVLDDQGELAGAVKAQEQDLLMWEEIGDKRGTASTENNLAGVLLERGDLSAATQHFESALQLQRETGYKAGQTYASLGWAQVLLHQDNLKAAREKAEQALALGKEIGEVSLQARALILLAWVSLEEDRAAESEKSASAAIHQLESVKSPERSASAYSIMALALASEGKLAEAQNAAQRAVVLAAKAGNRPPKFDAAMAAASVDAAAGRLAAARTKLSPVLAEASKFGYAGYALETRLALGDIALRSGAASAARAQLAALEKEARARNFLMIARKAAAAINEKTSRT